MDVNVSQLTERLKGMFIRQIGVLLGVLDSDIIVQKIQPYTEQSTKMVFLFRMSLLTRSSKAMRWQQCSRVSCRSRRQTF